MRGDDGKRKRAIEFAAECKGARASSVERDSVVAYSARPILTAATPFALSANRSIL